MNPNVIKWELQAIKSDFIAIFVAISLFFAGIIYGDAPIDIKITYDIPSQVYEYEVGDEVEIDATVENVGRPFIGVIDVAHGPDIDVRVFKYDEDGKKTHIYNNRTPYNQGEIFTDNADVEGYVKKGYKIEETYQFIIPEDAEKGEYSISVSRFGVEKVFENVITVK